jgi:SRSO17 transposase
MLQRALEAGVPAGWVTADEAGGGGSAYQTFGVVAQRHAALQAVALQPGEAARR